MSDGWAAVLAVTLVIAVIAIMNSLWLIRQRVDEIIRRLRGDQ